MAFIILSMRDYSVSSSSIGLYGISDLGCIYIYDIEAVLSSKYGPSEASPVY